MWDLDETETLARLEDLENRTLGGSTQNKYFLVNTDL